MDKSTIKYSNYSIIHYHFITITLNSINLSIKSCEMGIDNYILSNFFIFNKY